MQPSTETLSRLYPEYWWVETTSGSCYMVSAAMAQVVQRALARWPAPRCVSIVDLCGSRLTLRTRAITSIEQSSPATRAMWRRIKEEMNQE